MKTTKKICRSGAFAAVLAAGLAALSTGCQTTVPVVYTEPAKLDMSGIRRIGIISNDTTAMTEIATALMKTGKYSVITDKGEIAADKNRMAEWRQQQERLLNAQEVSADVLVKAYTDNAARADSRYGTLKVSGTVSEMKENFVRLGVGSDSVDVYTRPSENERIIKLNKGDTVTFVGECRGFKRPDSADTAEILRILGGGQHVNVVDALFFPIGEYKNAIDAVVTLKTTSSVSEDSKPDKRPRKNANGEIMKDAEGKTVYMTVETYRRVASVTVSYEVVRSSDSSLIGTGQKSGSTQTGYYDKKSDLPDASTLIPTAQKRPLQEIISDMVPTERTLSVKLAKSDNKELKEAMNEAKKLVSAKNYMSAAEAYGKIYAQTKDFAAGYNQAVLTEVALSTDKAIVLMEELAGSSGNVNALNMLAEMQRRSAANKQSAQQLEK